MVNPRYNDQEHQRNRPKNGHCSRHHYVSAGQLSILPSDFVQYWLDKQSRDNHTNDVDNDDFDHFTFSHMRIADSSESTVPLNL